MTVARITEISSLSKKGVWIKDRELTVDKGKIFGDKVTMKVTFILAD